MKKILLFAPLGLLLLGACSVTAETPTSTAVLNAAPYAEVDRRQERVQFTARIVERRGQCNTIRSRTGRLYSVQHADLRNFRPGTRIRVQGWVARRNGCPHPLIRVSGMRRI
ncbi:MAG: hypothetical protein RLT05_30800 [Bauldia litoralis]